MLGHSIATTVVEPNALFREGLSRILGAADFDVVASLSSLDNAELNALNQSETRLLVIGVSDDSDQAAAQIRQFYASGKNRSAAVLGHHLDQKATLSLFKAGARACLSHDATSEILIKSLELVTLGGTIVPEDILPLLRQGEAIEPAHALPSEEPPEPEGRAQEEAPAPEEKEPAPHECAETPHLSAQEKRILRHLIDGASNKIIARKVDIAEATVKVHVKAILRKVRLQNRTQAAVWALNNGAMIFGSGAEAPHRQTAAEEVYPLQPMNGFGFNRPILVGGERSKEI